MRARWAFAIKTGSWPKLFVPTALGQCLGAAHLGRIDIAPALAGIAFTLMPTLAIVLLNDWGDRAVDRKKRVLFPHSGSKKTIHDGILPAARVLWVGLAAAAGTLLAAYTLEHWLGRPSLTGIAVLGLALFWAYTFPPIKLNYRGGGELLEAIGVGFVLPWFHAYVQGGLGAESILWLPRAWAVLPGFVLLSFSSAVASGLSDEVSDKKGGKRTFVTALGNPQARRLCELSAAVGIAAWIFAGICSERAPLAACAVAGCVSALHLIKVVRESPSAITGAFPHHKTYKTHLHRAIWRGGTWLAALVLAYNLL